MLRNRAEILLEVDYYPPRAESLEALLLALEAHRVERVYLKGDRFFCWSFDSTLGDENAYPEELLSAFYDRAEAHGMRILPAVSASFLTFALSRRFGAEEPLSGPGIAYCRELFEDLLSFFYRNERELLLLESPPRSPQTAWAIEAASNLGIRTETSSWTEFPCWNPDRGVLENAARLEPLSWGSSQGSLLPGWLRLLPAPYGEEREELLNVFRRFGEELDRGWHRLRLSWEAAIRGETTEKRDLEGDLSSLRSLRSKLISVGCRLFLPPWFRARILSMERAYVAALLHQQAGDYSNFLPLRPKIE